MQLRIRAQQLEVPEATKAAIERRVRLALGRFVAGVERTQVRLFPSREAHPATRCRIRVRLRGGQRVTVEDAAEDPSSAAAAATWRLQHRMERHRAVATERAAASRRLGRR